MSEYIEECEVQAVSSKPTANGGTVYNIKVDIDGEEVWLGCGFDDPKVTKGAIVALEIVTKGDYENVKKGSIEIIEEGEAPKPARGGRGARGGRASKPTRGRGRAAPEPEDDEDDAPRRKAKPKAKAPAKAASKGTDWDRKDKQIRLQSCQNTATALIKIAIESGAVKLPSKQALKFDALQALVDEEAARLFQKYDDLADGKVAKKATKVEEVADPDADDYDDDDIPE